VISDFASTRISDSLEAKETLGSSQDDSLAIARRGSFLQDSFFSDIRRDFDASVREILKKCDDSDLTLTGDVSHSDILSRYRQLRSRNMREENQAFCVSSDSASLKVSPLSVYQHSALPEVFKIFSLITKYLMFFSWYTIIYT